MTASDRWARTAAALPTGARAERERRFWDALSQAWRWRRVVDAGCGSGFHLGLLGELGVEAVGFDLALAVLPRGAAGRTFAADLRYPALRAGAFDAALCLGNTLSLLASRSAQLEALGALAALVREGGVVLVQGEDVGALVAGGPVVRTRRLGDGTTHVRVFDRVGRRVAMYAGVVADDAAASLDRTWLLPTSAPALRRLARAVGLAPAVLPVAPPGGGPTWWSALSRGAPVGFVARERRCR